jgi:hypothetical protein
LSIFVSFALEDFYDSIMYSIEYKSPLSHIRNYFQASEFLISILDAVEQLSLEVLEMRQHYFTPL